MEITTTSTEQTKELAQQLSQEIKPGTILALYGDLGAGKTTFTRYLVEALGFDSRVQSPTFVIMRNYARDAGDINRVHHVDLYRLTSAGEAQDLDLAVVFEDTSAITIIEWPQIIEEQLPKETIKINFEYIDENSRKINVQNIS